MLPTKAKKGGGGKQKLSQNKREKHKEKWVAGSTHNVFLGMNAKIVESAIKVLSPSPRKRTFCLDWNLFGTMMTSLKKATAEYVT